MLFNSDITLFIFGWDDLSIGESGILKSPLPLLWGSVWNFTYSRSCFMNCMHLCLGQRLEPQYCLGEGFLWSVCSGLFITSFGWQSILSGIRIERSCLLHPSPWNSLFLPFTLCWCLSVVVMCLWGAGKDGSCSTLYSCLSFGWGNWDH